MFACAFLLDLAAALPADASELTRQDAPRLLIATTATVADTVSTAAAAMVDPEALVGEFEIRIDGLGLAARVLERRQEGVTTVVRFYLGECPWLSTVTRTGGKLAGWIETSAGAYYLQPSRDGGHILTAIADAALECDAQSTGSVAAPHLAGAAIRTTSRRRSVGAGRSLEIVELRVGIFLHDRAIAAMGGEENAKLLARNAVDMLNTALHETRDTGIRVILAFVKNNADIGGAGEPGIGARPDYSDPLAFHEALKRFADDPYVQRERFEEQLAFMSYWDVIGPGGGSAYIFEGRAAPVSGISVVGWHEAVARTFIHEVGHGLGLYHGRFSYPTAQRCSYCYGWENCAAERRDVMAGGTCFTRLQLYYSNMNRVVGGITAGSDEAHAARALRENRFLIRDSWQESKRGY